MSLRALRKQPWLESCQDVGCGRCRHSTLHHNFFVASSKTCRVAGVKEDTALTTNCLSLWHWHTCNSIGWVLVGESLAVACTREVDVATDAPASTPAVTDNPIVRCVANKLHAMVQSVITRAKHAFAASME